MSTRTYVENTITKLYNLM